MIEDDASGGYLVPYVFDPLVLSENPYRAFLRSFPPLTRRQRVIVRWRGAKWRIALAVDALMGRHYCGYDE